MSLSAASLAVHSGAAGSAPVTTSLFFSGTGTVSGGEDEGIFYYFIRQGTLWRGVVGGDPGTVVNLGR